MSKGRGSELESGAKEKTCDEKEYGGVDMSGRAELLRRHWFVNLRSGERAFDSRPFADSVFVLQVTSVYITVRTFEGDTAVIPWSAISFLSNSPGLGSPGVSAEDLEEE